MNDFTAQGLGSVMKPPPLPEAASEVARLKAGRAIWSAQGTVQDIDQRFDEVDAAHGTLAKIVAQALTITRGGDHATGGGHRKAFNNRGGGAPLEGEAPTLAIDARDYDTNTVGLTDRDQMVSIVYPIVEKNGPDRGDVVQRWGMVLRFTNF